MCSCPQSPRFLREKTWYRAACLPIFLLLSACQGTFPGGDGTSPTEKPSLTTGPPVQLTSMTVDATGGEISVTDDASPLAGFSVLVPEGAYAEPTTFRIAYEPILAHSLPSGFEPAAPLIDIDHGPTRAETPFGVAIPVEIPEGYFGMAFFYDRESGALEGIPCLAQNSRMLWVATRHSSSILPARVRIGTLDTLEIDTGFAPGVDTWQFQNWGSYISGGGNCSGMSLTAMWYYVYGKPIDNVQLYGKYDAWAVNSELKTPGFDLDDDSAIKLCSVAQKNLTAVHSFDSLLRNYSWGTDTMTGDAITFYSIAASFKAYGKHPVYLVVEDTNEGGSHAVICYRIDGHTLYVADPNYPTKRDRTISYTPGLTLAEGRLGPYQTVQSFWEELLGLRRSYDRVQFRGRTSVFNTVAIEKLWNDMAAGGIGQGEFPDLQYLVVERDAAGNIARTSELSTLSPYEAKKASVEIALNVSFEGRFHLYKYESLPGVVADSSKKDEMEMLTVQLSPGENLIGLHVEGKAAWQESYRDGNEIKLRDRTGWRWAGFDWLMMTYQEEVNPTGACSTESAAGAWRRAWDNDCDGVIDYEESEPRLYLADGTVSTFDGVVLEGYGWSVGEDNYMSFWTDDSWFSSSDSATVSAGCGTMENGRSIYYSVVGSIDSASCWTARRD
ncbi:MAG: hypothetical protein V1790_13600 [Planctomycetota bacterium]